MQIYPVQDKISISQLVGALKGKTAIRIFQKFSDLKIKLYWDNHFWAKGYYVDTVGLNEDMIRKTFLTRTTGKLSHKKAHKTKYSFTI